MKSELDPEPTSFPGPISAILRIVRLPTIAKPLDYAISGLFGVILSAYFGPNLIDYFEQPFDIAESIVISRSVGSDSFQLTKQRTRAGGRIDGLTCLEKGAMSPAFFINFRPQEEPFPVLENRRFIEGADTFYLVMVIYFEDQETSVVEWWDSTTNARIDTRIFNRKITNCVEVRDAFTNQ